MSQPGIDGIGSRIAHYRRLNRWSARQLAENTDGTVSRDTIANIENGRRADITVRQFLSIALALRVPPAALLTDLDRPLKPTDIRFPGTTAAPLTDGAPGIAVASWLNGQTDDDTTPAARWVHHVNGLLTDYLELADTQAAQSTLDRIARPRSHARDGTEERLHVLQAQLLAAGVDVPDPAGAASTSAGE